MKVSREFKVNVTAWGFFILSVLLVVVSVVVIWNSRTSHRPPPVPEQVEH
jgi:prolipoprotein diacylglyceryltransferase